MSEPARAPLASRPAPATWAGLERSLAEALSLLDGEVLLLEIDGTTAYVQLRASRARGIRAEAVSDAIRPEGERLGPDGRAMLRALGWSDPVPGGVPNHTRDFPAPAPVGAVAALLVRTLRSAYGAADPGRLAYRCFQPGGAEVFLPGLRLARHDAPRQAGAAPGGAPSAA